MEKWVYDGFPLEGEAVDESIDPQTILQLEDGTYQVDTDKSMVHWTGRNPGTTHYGTIQISRGEVRVQGGILTGQIDVDMNSIVNINLEGDELQPVLVSHLKIR